MTESQGELDRTVLPIQTPKRPTFTELDVRNVKMPPHFDVKAPADAPNVVIVLIDDLRYGARIETKGYGESQPVADNKTESGRRLNRRAIAITLGPGNAKR